MEKTHTESEKDEMPNLDALVNVKEVLSARDTQELPAFAVSEQSSLRFADMKKYLLSPVALAVGAVAVVALVVFFGYVGYMKYNSPEAQLVRAEQENKAMVEKARSLILLPDGVSPIIYTIEDPAMLAQEQSFFIGSEKGDKLLLYPNITKAVIYSPMRHIIVNAGPVDFGAQDMAGKK